MVDPEIFFIELKEKAGVRFWAGVPDSALKGLCAVIGERRADVRTIIAANEGNAVGLAAGSFLATGRVPVVYMQNSGQGNALNPLASLADPDVYGIPMLLIIGWRGKPGTADEPQHVKQGKITERFFDMMEIPYEIMAQETTAAVEQALRLCRCALERTGPAALIVSAEAFSARTAPTLPDAASLSREEAIELIARALPAGSAVVSTTGMISRELYECRQRFGQSHASDFLTVGSMGHSLQIAAGIACERSDRNVFCLDGDGAVLMHMGGLPVAASLRLKNLTHIMLNNAAHDSVGGQPTVAGSVDFRKISEGCGYARYLYAADRESLASILRELGHAAGPVFVEVRVRRGARKDLGRPKQSPAECKKSFMEFME